MKHPESEDTTPENEIPDPPVGIIPELDIEQTDAPWWVKDIFSFHNEERQARVRFERNQKIQLQEIRRVSRRVGLLEKDVQDLRERVEDIEDWRDGIDGTKPIERDTD